VVSRAETRPCLWISPGRLDQYQIYLMSIVPLIKTCFGGRRGASGILHVGMISTDFAARHTRDCKIIGLEQSQSNHFLTKSPWKVRALKTKLDLVLRALKGRKIYSDAPEEIKEGERTDYVSQLNAEKLGKKK